MLSNPVIGDKVFGFLHLKDLKSAALVCRDFKTFLDCRKFWRQAEIRIRQDVLSSDRIQNIGNFVVDRKTGVEALLVLLRFLLDKSEDCVLEHIRFVLTDLSPLTIPTLASAVCTVREVSFNTSVLSTSQVQEVMTSVSLSPRLVVRKLNMCGQDMSEVSADTIATAVCRLEDVNLRSCDLTPMQLNLLFRTISQGHKIRIRRLDLIFNDLSEVDPCVLASSLRRLESVAIDDNEITTEQIKAFFKGLVRSSDIGGCSSFNLKKLDIRNYDLSGLTPDMIGAALVKFEEVNISDTHLTPHHLAAVFQTITTSPIVRLVRLDCSKNDVSSVPGDLLTDAVSRLETVNMSHTRLNQAQLLTLCKRVADNPGSMRTLKLGHTPDLVLITPQILAGAVCRLEEMSLSAWDTTELTVEQLDYLCTAITECSSLRLRSLELSSQDLSDITPDTLALAVCCLEDVDLYDTKLTTRQLDTLFNVILDCKDLKLRRLDLAKNDLGGVEPGKLGAALCRVVDVDLEYTEITSDSIRSLARVITEQSVQLRYLNLRDNEDSDNVKQDILDSIIMRLARFEYECDLHD